MTGWNRDPPQLRPLYRVLAQQLSRAGPARYQTLSRLFFRLSAGDQRRCLEELRTFSQGRYHV